MNIEMNELRGMLANHMEGLEIQRLSYAKRVVDKVNAIGRLGENQINSQLLDSMLRDVEIYNAQMRDIERELFVVKHYEWQVREK